MTLKRRIVVFGGVASALVGAVVAAFGWREAEALKRQRLANEDDVAGRVTLVDGWILSESEAASVKR